MTVGCAHKTNKHGKLHTEPTNQFFTATPPVCTGQRAVVLVERHTPETQLFHEPPVLSPHSFVVSHALHLEVA
jgi:hypothetical protein